MNIESEKKKMTYLSINFPKKYDNKTKIYLREMLSEKEGIKFSFILMKKIIDTQVERIDWALLFLGISSSNLTTQCLSKKSG